MENQKIRWGILSTAKIGRLKVIPAIQKSTSGVVEAIASRNLEQAKSVAASLGITQAYGSYEELLLDPIIDVVYNPLPNHLHIPWTIKAMQAGKHVLCEKPIGLDAKEAQHLIQVSKNYPRLKVMEAFMYRFHPQWIKVKQLIDDGTIGDAKVVQSVFSYYNDDPANIRNMVGIGGGGLMDIGCYCISFPRFLFDAEPIRVLGLIENDPQMNIDRLCSGLLDFADGKSSNFTCSTQLMPFQRCTILGTEGSIEIKIPVNAPADQAVKITVTTKESEEVLSLDAADQYTLQADAFCSSIFEDTPVPTPLADGLKNMEVIDAIFQSSRKNEWVQLLP